VSISIIVLAAGASRRMGKPKPLLAFGGETCLSLVLNACVRSHADETILVLGDQAERIRADIVARAGGRLPIGVSTVTNEGFDRGQTSSLKTGLEAASARADAFVVFPVDHPLVESSDIDALIARFEARPRGRSIFIATYESQRGHPTLFKMAHRASILELGDDDPLNAFIRLRQGEAEQVPSPNAGVVSGMNTQQDYERLLGIYMAMRAAEDARGGAGRSAS